MTKPIRINIKQQDRLLKRLPPKERQKQEAIRKLIELDQAFKVA
jgi:hypothetical protein